MKRSVIPSFERLPKFGNFGSLGVCYSSSADRLLRRLQLPAQPLAGHVQPTLDGTDRRLEFAAHLLERSAANVERLQRLPVQSLEPIQAVPKLGALLGADHLVQRVRRVAMRTVICRSQPAKQRGSRSWSSFFIMWMKTSCDSSCASAGLRSRTSANAYTVG